MRNLLLFITFFTVTPLTLVASLFSLFAISKEPNFVQAQVNLIETPRFGVQVYAALPPSLSAISANATPQDARVEIIRQYLERWESPLEPYADFIVSVSDQYGLDFRLLTAIAQQESNLCKKSPPQSYNCWGWGIHSNGTLTFASYTEAVEAVASGLRGEYLDKGYDTVEEIMTKYTPLSSGSWAFGVQKFMEDME